MVEIKSIYRNEADFYGKEVVLKGWIRNIRTSKAFGFIELNDGTFFKNLQVVFDEKLDNFEEISKLYLSSSIEVRGQVIKTENAKQSFEVLAKEIILLGSSTQDYPIQKKKHSFEYLREMAHLRPRTNTFSAVFRVRSVLSYAIHKYFNDNGFYYIHTPIITGSDCEGAGEMFQVSTLDPINPPKLEGGAIDYSKDFFGKAVNLTVSGQLAVENFVQAFSKVYTFGPTFRAENSNTTRHAAEFWMIEPEMAFTDLQGNMDAQEDMIKYIVRYVLENAPEEMEFFNSFVDKGLFERLDNLLNSDFGRLDYTEAIRILKESGKAFEYPVNWEDGLQTEHERYLAEEVYKRPVFVYNYPKEIKAFYMRQNEDGKTVAASDLLAPGVGELIGGSQREERYDNLLARINELGLPESELWWYLDLRRYGTTVHSGYGLGFARMMMYITGMTNIRDVIPFPRTKGLCEF